MEGTARKMPMDVPSLSAMRELSVLMCLPLALVQLVGHAQMDSQGMERSVPVRVLVACMLNLWSCNCNNYIPCFHADINECNTTSVQCAHICTNTIGSYECTCRDGYYPNPSMPRECEGTCVNMYVYTAYDMVCDKRLTCINHNMFTICMPEHVSL